MHAVLTSPVRIPGARPSSCAGALAGGRVGVAVAGGSRGAKTATMGCQACGVRPACPVARADRLARVRPPWRSPRARSARSRVGAAGSRSAWQTTPPPSSSGCRTSRAEEGCTRGGQYQSEIQSGWIEKGLFTVNQWSSNFVDSRTFKTIRFFWGIPSHPYKNEGTWCTLDLYVL